MAHTFKRHVIGYTWENSQLTLLTRNIDRPEGVLRLNVEDKITIRKLDRQFCIGWADFEGMHLIPCETKSSVVGSQVQCPECRKKEGFYHCLICTGDGCRATKLSVRNYCQLPHHLYLSCFGNSAVKVGTASQPRKEARILDQGPLAAAYVARGSGSAIRQLEKAVSSMGYTERVTRREKLRLLASKMSIEEVQSLIEGAYNDIITTIGDDFHPMLHEPEFIWLDHLYNRQNIYMPPEPIEIEPMQVVSGKIVAKRGNFLILDRNGMLGAIDLAKLKSWIIEFNPDVDISDSFGQQTGFFDQLFG